MRFEFTEDLRREYRRMFRSLAVRPERRAIVQQVVDSLVAHRRRYERAGAPVGVPWWFVAILHDLEDARSFHRVEPSRTWAQSATDALTRDGLADVGGWSITRALYRFERRDGFGYRRRAVASPYLWSFSQHYERGAFVADGVFDPELVSRRCGAAVLLRTLVDGGHVARV
jgi:lysozyme family protein